MTDPRRRRRLAVILINLGTPEQPSAAAVRRYLAEFLWDPRVVEIPRLIWWPILHLLILPVRPRKSARAYRAIWTDEGSPLLTLSRRLTMAVETALYSRFGNAITVALAMRYGRPSIAETLTKLQQNDTEGFIILPLYPQYASSSTGSVFDVVASTLKQWRHIPEVRFISDYHDHPAYIEAIVRRIRSFWQDNGRSGHLLFSFHGLPERSCLLGDPYFGQCQTSARLIAEALGLDQDCWQVVFQSRFGAARWLQPYCIDVLASLPGRGIRDVDIVCPGFAVDCLETLEEIGITNRRQFLEAGGSRCRLIPCLNDSPEHVASLTALVSEWLPVGS